MSQRVHWLAIQCDQRDGEREDDDEGVSRAEREVGEPCSVERDACQTLRDLITRESGTLWVGSMEEVLRGGKGRRGTAYYVADHIAGEACVDGTCMLDQVPRLHGRSRRERVDTKHVTHLIFCQTPSIFSIPPTSTLGLTVLSTFMRSYGREAKIGTRVIVT